jgi:hypothetical protein
MPAARKRIKHKPTKKTTPISFRPWLFVGLGVIVVAVIIFLAVNGSKAANPTANAAGTDPTPSPAGLMGDPVPVASAAHVPEGSVPGPYASDPPAGGTHYPVNYTAKFYQESDLPSLPAHPEGYLVHSLEHGYVIYWYNCKATSTIDCTSLKALIQKAMDEAGDTKLIAFPWSSMDVPVAMTSWGRILKMSTPDEATMVKFANSNRYKSPEPDGP